MKKHIIHFVAGAGLLIASCGSHTGNQGRGPIVLGDTSTIVTEKDPQYLKDDVSDVTPMDNKTTETPKKQQAPEAAKPLPPEPVSTPAAKGKHSGLTITFDGVQIAFDGIQTKEFKKQNPQKDNGLTYSVQSGSLGNAKLYIGGATNVTVKEKYQTRLTLKSDLGFVDLRNLGLYSSGWNSITASNSGGENLYSLKTLNNLVYNNVNFAKIKNATDRELRNRRTNSHTIQSWMNEIRKVRSAKDDPCEILLDNAQWQISGTDAQGKKFQKSIRIESPIK